MGGRVDADRDKRGVDQGFTLALPPDKAAPSLARGAAKPLRRHMDDDTWHDTVLMISELVTNSVRHAGHRSGSLIVFSVNLLPDRLRVEVTDPGGGFQPTGSPPDEIRSSGMGLRLVEHLADRWGVTAGPNTVVWFEIDVREESSPRPG